MWRSIVPAAAAVVFCGAVATTGTAGAESSAAIPCSATDDAIYTPPAGFSSSPGDVLACMPATLPKVPPDVPIKAWKIQYHSKDSHGHDVAVPGIVAVPEAPWRGGGPRPVVAFNHGTLGLGSRCAYSKQMSGAYVDAYEQQQLGEALRAGYAVVAPDGIGYLNGQTPTYMVGRNAGQVLLDGVRAASRVPEAGVNPQSPVGLWGYSEGGQGALWGAQLAASYAPELKVVGTAAGGVPGDLRVVGNELNGGQFAGFAGAALVGFHAGYPDMPFDELLNDTGRAAVDKLKNSCLIDTVFGFNGKKVEDYTTDHLTPDQLYALPGPNGVTWGQIADSHKVGVGIGTPGSGAEHVIGFPVLQYRGETEQIIPVATEEDTRHTYCAAGIPTEWKVYPGADHLSGARAAIQDVIAWLGDRFTGKPPASNCD